jgi:hypothetical protein
MDTVQKLAVPLSIVIAGAMIAAAVFISNAGRAPVAQEPGTPTVEKEIRGVQDSDHILGSKDATLILVEYSDTECPFCKQFHDTLQRIRRRGLGLPPFPSGTITSESPERSRGSRVCRGNGRQREILGVH